MESGLEKIQTLEDSMIRRKDSTTVEHRGQAPVFTSPLSNIDNLREGENAHFEARLTPTDDSKLTVRMFIQVKTLYNRIELDIVRHDCLMCARITFVALH